MPKDLSKENGAYKVSLYENYEENPVQETDLSGAKTSYQFTELKPNTDYYIEILVESEEYYGYLSAEVKTLSVEGSVKDVNLYVYHTEDEPEADVMFDLYGIDPETEEQYFYGWSDENGRLWDHMGDEAVDLFKLPAGNYEIVFVTTDEEEVIFRFEIEADEDYIENPIYFVLNEEVSEQTPPLVMPDDRDQDSKQPVKVNKPSQPDKVKSKKTKKKRPS